LKTLSDFVVIELEFAILLNIFEEGSTDNP